MYSIYIEMKKDPVVIKQSKSITQKSVKVRPDKNNQVFSYGQIKNYVSKQIEKLPKNAKVIVRATNILRETTLKGYNDEFMSEEEYDEYTRGKVKDNTKFKHFLDFTVTIIESNNQNMFGF